MTPEQAAGIRASTLSLAQAITGQIVMYAVQMGIDPRIVAFASATPSRLWSNLTAHCSWFFMLSMAVFSSDIINLFTTAAHRQ